MQSISIFTGIVTITVLEPSILSLFRFKLWFHTYIGMDYVELKRHCTHKVDFCLMAQPYIVGCPFEASTKSLLLLTPSWPKKKFVLLRIQHYKIRQSIFIFSINRGKKASHKEYLPSTFARYDLRCEAQSIFKF